VSSSPEPGSDDASVPLAVDARHSPAEPASADTPPQAGTARGGALSRRKQSARQRLSAAQTRYRALAERQPVLGLPFPFIANYQRPNCALLAGSLAFRLFMWLLPFALVVAGLFSLVVNEADWDISQAVHAAGVSGAASQEVEQAVLEAHKSWWIAVFVGLVLTLWTGRSLARALTMMHAHVWEMPVPRQSQSQRLVNGVLLLFVFLFAVFASAVTSRLNVLSWFLGAAALTVVVGVGWLLISKWLPSRATSWRQLLPGALLVGMGLAAMNTAGTVYLPHRIQHASAMYGTLGVAAAILIWLFVFGQLLVCAALVNAVWARYVYGSASKPG
jgi:membrane protein